MKTPAWLTPLLLISFAFLPACKDLTNDRSQSLPRAVPSGVIETTTNGNPLKDIAPVPGATAPQNEGGDVSGGGAGYEGEFKNILEKVIARMEHVGLYSVPLPEGAEKMIWTDDLRKLLTEAKISFTEKELKKVVDGVEKDVDALNYPSSKLIEVNSPRWKAMTEKGAREHLVTHEVAGLFEVEKNVYDGSNYWLSTLRRLENPQSPEDLCPVEAQGTHGGSACLWALSEEESDGIKAIEETLLKFAEVKSEDDEVVKSGKERIKKYVETQAANLQEQMDAKCRDASLAAGNDLAYEGSACDAKFLRTRRQQMRDFYNRVRAYYPEIPVPRAAQPFNG